MLEIQKITIKQFSLKYPCQLDRITYQALISKPSTPRWQRNEKNDKSYKNANEQRSKM